jgi:hypothetical protein
MFDGSFTVPRTGRIGNPQPVAIEEINADEHASALESGPTNPAELEQIH